MDKEKIAIERLKIASEMSLRYYGKPLLVTYSGGKDSDVSLELTKRSGIPFEVQYHHTTADAPETVYHIKKIFYDLELINIKCSITKPHYQGKSTTMWSLIPLKLMPPTRVVRYCCQTLKESGGDGRMITTGVRWDESPQRNTRGAMEVIGDKKKNSIILTNDNDVTRRYLEKCELRAKTVCNTIIDWTNTDIWDYIHSEKIKVNPLYECGFKRVGCIGCPMAGNKRYFEFGIYPKYKQMYIMAFERMNIERKRRGLNTVWRDGLEVFEWWMQEMPGQYELEFNPEENTLINY